MPGRPTIRSAGALCALLAALALAAAPALALDSSWKVDAAGNWGDAANWTAGVPDAVGDIARLTYDITAPRKVTIEEGSRTVGSLYLNDDNYGYTVRASQLRLNVASGSALVQADGGSGVTHTIDALVGFYDPLVVAVNGGTLQLLREVVYGAASVGITKSGAGILVIAISHYWGDTVISGGALQAADGVGLPASSFLSLDGGVLQTSGTFTRGLGTSGTKFRWTDNGGGFSAYGGSLTVNIGGSPTPTELVWGATVGSNIVGTLKFGSANSNNQTELKNGIDLNGATRTIDVAAGAGGDSALLSGVIRTSTGTAGITKTGAGVLALAGANTYTGSTVIRGGALQAAQGAELPAGSFISLDGGVFQTSGTFTRGLGTSGTKFQWTSNGGGFSAYGGSLTVNIGGSPTPTELAWGTTVGSNIVGTLKFGSANSNNQTELKNRIDLKGATRTIHVAAGAGGDSALLSGVIRTSTGTAGIVKTGMGTLVLSAANNFTGGVTVAGGTLRLASASALRPGNSITLQGGGTLDIGAFSFSVGPVVLADGTISGNTGVLTATAYDVRKGTITGRLGGSTGLTKTTADTVTLAGDNTYTGATQVSEGILVVANCDALGAVARSVTVSNGATLWIEGDVWGIWGVWGDATLNGTGAGGIGAMTGRGLWSGRVTMASNCAIGGGPEGLSIGKIVSGNADLTILGTVLLNRNNTYAGRTIIKNNGHLTVCAPEALDPAGFGTVVETGGRLSIGEIGDPLTVTGKNVALAGGTLTGYGTWAGAVTLAAQSGISGSELTVSGIISDGGKGYGITCGGAILSAANTFSGPTTITANALRATDGVGIPAASNLVLSGGYFEGDGTAVFTRNLGASGPNTVQWAGSGGFSSKGGTLTVALGGLASPTPLVWGAGGFVPRDCKLKFQHTYGDGSIVDFRNDIDLAGETRTVEVYSFQSAVLSGVLSNGGLTIGHFGRLVLSGANTYAGPTTLYHGILHAVDGVGLPASSNLVLSGGYYEGDGPTVFSRNIGTSGPNTVQWTYLGGGFSSKGGKMTVALGGLENPTRLVWGVGGFVPLGTSLQFGASGADGETELKNDIDLAGGNQRFNVRIPGYFATLSGTLSNGGLVKCDAGALVLSGANTYEGTTTIMSGVLRATDGVGLPTLSNLVLAGGCLEGGGPMPFTRSLGTAGPSTVQWTGSGGFSARGGKLTVALGGIQSPSPLTWGQDGFVPSGYSLVFGSATADNETEFKNNIDLAGAARTVAVDDAAATSADFATLSGILSNGSLTKGGSGTLVLTGANAYAGSTTVSKGALRATDAIGLPSASNLVLTAGALESEGTTVFTRDLGPAGGQVQWNNGGFSAYGGKMTVAIGGTASPTALTWGSAYFVPSGKAILFGSTTANDETELINSVNLAGGQRTITVNDNPFSTGDFATLSGTLSNGGISKDGAGLLVLKGANTYTGTTTIAAGTLKLAPTSAMATSLFDIAAGATLDVREFLGGYTLPPGAGLKGGGTVLGGLVASGTVAPGSSAGILTVDDVTFAVGSALEVEIGGTARGTQYDVLAASGTVTLEGGSNLSVALIGAYVPGLGDEFDIMDFAALSGQFTTVSLPALAGGLAWNTDALYTSGVIGVVPEPATAAMLLAGLAFAALRRRPANT